MLTTSSEPSFVLTICGVFQEEPIPLVFQTSSPVFLSRAYSMPLSTLAFTMSLSPSTTGDVPEPQPLVPSPTLACHFWLPSRSKQKTPDLPKKTYSHSPSLAGVLPA